MTTGTGFPCTSCGACCRSIRHILPLFDSGDGSCVHLVDNRCSIYNDRPTICRVDDIKPADIDKEVWYKMNLAACDKLHLRVYGTKRPK